MFRMSEPPDSSEESSIGTKSSFAEAFAFIKDSEFYSEAKKSADAARREEGNEEGKRRKLETNEPVTEKVTKITVSSRQRGNPLLAHIRNVPLSYSSSLVPDYVMGSSSCALFLSLKYHRLHNEYIYERLRELGKGFTVRILLALVDVPDTAMCIKELTKAALLSDCTLLLAWSNVEAARYLEAFKVYEHKPAEALQGRIEQGQAAQEAHFLTSIRGVNKTDVTRLKKEFGSVAKVVLSSSEHLAMCHGVGDKKAQRIHDIFRAPFRNYS